MTTKSILTHGTSICKRWSNKSGSFTSLFRQLKHKMLSLSQARYTRQ